MLLSLLIFAIPIQQGYGLISGVSEYFDEKPNLYRMGSGIREFVEDPKDEPCTVPKFEIKDVNLSVVPIQTLAETEGNFFMVLNQHGTDSYRYLEVLMPEGNGQSRYYGYVYDENNKKVTGYGFGLDSSSLVTGIETFDNEAIIDEDKRLDDYVDGKPKSGLLAKPVKQGDYRTNIVLYHYEQPRTDKKTCTLVVDWDFSVNYHGEYLTGTVDTRTGTLVDIAAEFSPRQQKELGMESFAVQCKEGYQKLSQKDHFFHKSRTICVSPETKYTLIERGWNLAEPKSELEYFEKDQEMEIGQKYVEFMQKQDYNNVPNSFVIGKYNFKGDETITYFCGEFKDITVNYDQFFNGAIDSSGNLEWDGVKELSPWCAIKDNAHKFSFIYLWQQE